MDFSLQFQKSSLEQYCQIKKYNVIQHFEEDYSAKTFKRPQWERLKDFVRLNKNNIDLILCLKRDRFSRNQTDALVEIRELRNKYGVEVNTSEQPLDLTQSESKLLLSIYLATPEIENDKNSLRTTDGSRQARLEGCWTGTAPFGYSNYRNPAGKSTLRPNDKAEIVKKIFLEFSKGIYAADELRKKIFAEGVKFSKMAFLGILRNVAYTGKITIKAWGKFEDSVVEGLHEAIIEDGLFYKVQGILSGRKRNKVTLHSQSVEQLPLRGLIKCKSCGGNLTGSKPKGRNNSYFYYHCNNNNCKERFRANFANSAFEDYLSTFYFPEEVVELYGYVLEDAYKSQNKESEAKSKSLEEQIEKQKKSIEKLQDLLVNESITDEDYKSMKDRYNGSLNDLIMKYTELSMDNKSSIQKLRFAVSLLKDLPLYYANASLEAKRSITWFDISEKVRIS